MTAGCLSEKLWYMALQIRIFEFLSIAKYRTATTFIDSKGIAKNKD